MKSSKFIFAISIFMASVSFSQPKISLDRPELDLGIVYGGARKKGRVVLKNIGTDTLKIMSVHTSCGCTTVKKPKDFLIPGESDILEIEFHASGLPGKANKSISIETNDPTSHYTTVKLMAEIKQDLQQVGQQVFLNIKIGTSEVIDILLKNTSGHRLRIKGFSINSTSSTVKMDKNVVEKNDTLKAQVTLTADKIGYVSEFLNIETDSKEDPTIPVQIQYIGVKDN